MSVTLTLHALQEAGLISHRRSAIMVLDRKSMEAASCECYSIVKKEYKRLCDAYSSGNGSGRLRR